ncbi:CPBP family intramembrane glutamic endopeptidase [Streptococcus parasanguinis]|uniref:CPBP family intramembrane glutamic endopeptidase n=1 Tax=Streptococcus parasanguinis TaxID=1318 RepID=UPI00228479CE|nr:CPBP family intramembrane glutamic endopeptidase [Streptococcus parasanguinis]MCY7049631.1 CPBP family intramembrane metalloprotease [Streptococcus parasanguinis]
MSRKQALSMYLLGTFGQVLGVSLLVWFLRAGGTKVDFTSPMGMIAVVLGGLSSAFWGSLASIGYHQSSFKQILKDFFQVKDSLANYCLVLVFLLLDFFPFILGGTITTQSLVLPVVLFFKALLFGGIEEIGWRYFFQPTLEERIPYLSATLITFLAWSSWHLFYFYIDGSLGVIQLLPFLVGLLTNCFILSALYHKTQNLWICVMTHACINSLSQMIVNENVWLSIISKILIISLAIMFARKKYVTVKEEK